MTAQMPDLFVWRGHEYALVGIDGGPLFDPADHGLEVRMISTACWRGYICRYAVDGDELVIRGLMVGMDEPPTELFGAARDSGGWYQPVRVPVPFTGGLLVGDGFVRELYVHMGFHPAWKYRHVHELLFESGRLTAHHDRSAAMAEIRGSEPQLRPDSHDADETRRWIERTFDRSYGNRSY
jgi:hypothetical protein